MPVRRALAVTAPFLVLLACQPSTASQPRALAVFEAYVQAWNHHDLKALDTLLAADGIHEDLAQRFTGHGAAEVRAFMQELLKAEPDFAWHVVSTIVVGDTVAAEWTWSSTYTGPSPNGPVEKLPIAGRGASISIVQAGHIKRFTDYYDSASYFPAAAADTARR